MLHGLIEQSAVRRITFVVSFQFDFRLKLLQSFLEAITRGCDLDLVNLSLTSISPKLSSVYLMSGVNYWQEK